MIKIQWLESFAIGNEKIDRDHKDIIAIMQDVRSAVEDDNRPRCSALLQDLIVRAQEHFTDEEEILESVHYPDLAEHIRYHQDLLLKARAMNAICHGASANGNLEQCFTVMAEFLIDDIIAGDLKFKSFIKEI
ncbi:MAG: hemerythrin domain-containing protein [Rhodospirillaceae bacterium]|nr:hemerythrin domain-containing protein [Rhodospirillaceae bacterium]